MARHARPSMPAPQIRRAKEGRVRNFHRCAGEGGGGGGGGGCGVAVFDYNLLKNPQKERKFLSVTAIWASLSSMF